MSISRFNAEGYYDPTAHKALTTVHKAERAANAAKAYRPLVYICSPYSGDVERNTEAARRYCRFAANKGYTPLAPHLLFTQFLNDDIPAERELGMIFGNILMGKCTEVWVFGKRVSPGMEAEIERAERKAYRLRYFTEACEEAAK